MLTTFHFSTAVSPENIGQLKSPTFRRGLGDAGIGVTADAVLRACEAGGGQGASPPGGGTVLGPRFVWVVRESPPRGGCRCGGLRVEGHMNISTKSAASRRLKIHQTNTEGMIVCYNHIILRRCGVYCVFGNVRGARVHAAAAGGGGYVLCGVRMSPWASA